MIKTLLFFLLFTSISLNVKLQAQGTIMINPKRVVFNNSELKHTIAIMNTGDVETQYVVSFLQQRMNEDGSFTTITEPDPGQRFADKYLRIYPRQVLLQAGESQIVVIQRRRNNKMEMGEYRSHLTFMAVPNASPLQNEDNIESSDFSTSISTIFGMSIPIILHSGEVAVSTKINDIKLEGKLLTFNLHRKGNISTYGNFLIQYIPEQGEPITIKKLVGVAVYTTIEKRMMKFNLDNTSDLNLKKGSLKVIYESSSGSVKNILAEGTLLLKP
jgi:hypothetical protein